MTPLSSMANKKLIGWSVHGSWQADENDLKFGNFDDSSFTLNNFLPLSSTHVNYFIRFKPNFDMTKKKDDGAFETEEVILFGFSPYMHDSREFDKNQTYQALHGLLLYFYRSNGEGIVRIET